MPSFFDAADRVDFELVNYQKEKKKPHSMGQTSLCLVHFFGDYALFGDFLDFIHFIFSLPLGQRDHMMWPHPLS